jgi:hypothetical protein
MRSQTADFGHTSIQTPLQPLAPQTRSPVLLHLTMPRVCSTVSVTLSPTDPCLALEPEPGSPLPLTRCIRGRAPSLSVLAQLQPYLQLTFEIPKSILKQSNMEPSTTRPSTPPPTIPPPHAGLPTPPSTGGSRKRVLILEPQESPVHSKREYRSRVHEGETLSEFFED